MSGRVAVLGLGAMGLRLAGNAARAGRSVVAWNRTAGPAQRLAEQHPEVRVAETAAAAAGAAAVVIAMVADDEASREVWLGSHGALAALSDAAVGIEASTLSPGATVELAAAFDATGRAFLAAPVLGSTPQADAGELVQLVGGDPAVLERVTDVLEVSAARVVHVGRPADAAHRKLVVNGWLAGQTALAGELVAHLVEVGLARTDAAAFLAGLPLTSPALAGVLARMGAGDDDPRFPMRLVAKDAGYLSSAAGRPLLDAVAGAWAAAARARPDADLSGYLDALTTPAA